MIWVLGIFCEKKSKINFDFYFDSYSIYNRIYTVLNFCYVWVIFLIQSILIFPNMKTPFTIFRHIEPGKYPLQKIKFLFTSSSFSWDKTSLGNKGWFLEIELMGSWNFQKWAVSKRSSIEDLGRNETSSTWDLDRFRTGRTEAPFHTLELYG
jgi:hypothetical protein